jgi:putative ATP-dependent endonuclease of the OLD family
MRGRPKRATPASHDAGSVLVRLAAVRIQGFRGIPDLDIELDPITTIIGEHGATKAAFVEFLDLCLGPRSTDRPRIVPGDFYGSERGGPSRIRAALHFVEGSAGAWRAREPDLAAVALTRKDGRSAVTVEIGAACAVRDGRLRAESFVDVRGARGRAAPASGLAVWRRLKSLVPVLVLGADRGDATPPDDAPERMTPRHAEIARLYRRLRESRGRLSAREIESARAVLRDEMRFDPSRALVLEDDRALVDVVDWRRPADQDVTDDAVQDVLMRLVRAGLMLEAKGSRRMHHEATPIVVVESPDARLHPILAARVWRFLHSVASQIVVTTNSSEVVATAPLRSLRRLTRGSRRVHVTRIRPSEFSIDDLRRIVYHVRLKRGASLLARAWFLLEGETEIWILTEFAAMLGYSFPAEGIACIEFAQCGLDPLVRLADQLGIGWHVLADGDPAGVIYAAQARSRLAGRSAPSHVTMLRVPDIEHALWHSGYSDVFRRSAGGFQARDALPKALIRRALAKASKPLLAIRVIEEAAGPRSPGVPETLAAAIKAVVSLARRGGRGA